MLNVNRPMMLDRAPAAEDGSLVDLGQLAGMAKRRWKLIVGCMLAFAILSVLYLLQATPLFVSEAELIVDTTTSAAMQKSDLTDAGQVDTSLVDSQVEIITSDNTARAVVRKLNLASDPEFVGPGKGIMTAVGGAIGQVLALVSPKGEKVDDSEQRAVDAFKKGLVVKRTGLTYVITVDYWSQDPAKAALVANTVMNAYIDSVLDAKYAATRRTSDWLQGRLQDIRKQANDADRALQMFKSSHNIVDTNRGLMSEQQLAELNSTLATSRAATAEAKARLDTARSVGSNPLGTATVSDALSNPVISRLRAQYLDLNNKANDLAARYGQNHRSVTDLRAQMAQITRSVQDELSRITDAYASDYKIAQAREASLQTSLNQLVSQNDTSSLDKVKLQDLESTADSLRALYNGYLQRSQEAAQRESFPIADARTITQATPPLRKSSPKSLLVLAGGLAFGLIVGIGSAFARELGNAFVTPEDVEGHAGLPCLGVLPAVGGGKGKPDGRGRSADTMVLDAPFSRYAETIRNIKISIDTMPGAGKGAHVVAVTSAVPGEGKTTVALNLAQMIANAGNRVLLIDGDLANRQLTARAGRPSRVGLLEALAEPAKLPFLVQRDERTRLDVLPCAADAPIPHRAEILASERMADLLGRARDAYQYVILDLAPIVPVVDARAVARLVDCFVMVVEWQKTSRKVVAEALSTEVIQQRTLGAVLNKVDVRALQQMESYKGKNINAYYIDDKVA